MAEQALPGQGLEHSTPPGLERLAQGGVAGADHDLGGELLAGEDPPVEDGGGRVGQRGEAVGAQEGALARRLLPGPRGGEQRQEGGSVGRGQQVQRPAHRPDPEQPPLGQCPLDLPGLRSLLPGRDRQLGGGGNLGLHAAQSRDDPHHVIEDFFAAGPGARPAPAPTSRALSY